MGWLSCLLAPAVGAAAAQAYDRVGNRCVEGGASVVAACIKDGRNDPSVTCAAEDGGDGTYTLRWQSRQTGTFDAKVTIGHAMVRHSPMKIQIVSTRPDIDKTLLEVEGDEIERPDCA